MIPFSLNPLANDAMYAWHDDATNYYITKYGIIIATLPKATFALMATYNGGKNALFLQARTRSGGQNGTIAVSNNTNTTFVSPRSSAFLRTPAIHIVAPRNYQFADTQQDLLAATIEGVWSYCSANGVLSRVNQNWVQNGNVWYPTRWFNSIGNAYNFGPQQATAAAPAVNFVSSPNGKFWVHDRLNYGFGTGASAGDHSTGWTGWSRINMQNTSLSSISRAMLFDLEKALFSSYVLNRPAVNLGVHEGSRGVGGGTAGGTNATTSIWFTNTPNDDGTITTNLATL
jgi:hypothetical protein